MTLLQRLLILALGMCLPAAAQVVRMGPVARPMGIVIGGATVTATPPNVTFALNAGGAATGSAPVVVSTQITAIGVLSTVQIVAYFASSNALSTTAGDTIATSDVWGRCSTCSSTAWRTFTETSALGGANSLVLENGTDLLAILGGTRTYSLSLKIDLTNQPQQPAGAYSGTLVLAAQMF